ncbi:MAG TPA: DEAD/DEAH box helicase, partial [Ilumatobacteraceae bacterium]|nr:DEAD/DEAH box helicase [Ilumatobacteraceae bacterium]
MTPREPGRAEPEAESALGRVTAALPAAEDRPGQREMAGAVASAIEGARHLIVQAGTGTGKTMAYLVPAVLSGRRVVIATATKALQDQLAAKDLPFLAEHLGAPFDWAVLKGRSNYICMQRV